MKIVLLVLSFLCLALYASAQSSIQVGINGGVALYNGDLSPAFNRDYPKFFEEAFGIFVRKDLTRKISIRGHYHNAQLAGNDVEAGREFRNLNFRNRISEFAGILEYDLLNVRTRQGGDFSFFLFAGGAATYHNPKTFYQNTFIELQPLGTEGQGINGNRDKYSRLIVAIPFGGGLKIPVGAGRAQVIIEAGARKLFTDYIDDVGRAEVDFDELLVNNGPLAVALFDRTHEILGTEPRNFGKGVRGGEFEDWYYMFTVGVGWNLNVTGNGGSNARCPTF